MLQVPSLGLGKYTLLPILNNNNLFSNLCKQVHLLALLLQEENIR